MTIPYLSKHDLPSTTTAQKALIRFLALALLLGSLSAAEEEPAMENGPEAIYQDALKHLDSSGPNYSRREAVKLLKQASKLEYAPAMNDLGLHYQTGTGMLFKRPRTGFKWLLKSAEQEYLPAMFNVALAYEEGTGTRADADKAREIREHIVEVVPDPDLPEDDFTLYQNIIAETHVLLGDQDDEKKEYASALNHYTKAADLEHLRAQLNTARYHALGLGTESNLEKADGYIDAAGRNLSRRIRRVANVYFSESLLGNTEASLLKEEAESDAKDMVQRTRILIGRELAESEELPDPERAAQWFRLAADDGGAYAAARLGAIFLDGRDDLVSEEEARKFLEAARKEHLWVGYHLTGVLKQDVDHDADTAREMFQTGADRGFYASFLALSDPEYARPVLIKDNIELATKNAEAGDSDAAYYYGLYQWLDLIEGKDQHSAVAWFKKAHEGGNPYGTHYYGLCLYYNVIQGFFGNRDKAAVELFQQSADAGVAISHYMLGFDREHGYGSKMSISQAVAHYKDALAADPSTPATRILAEFYLEGKGVSKDEERAYELFQLASENGSSLATKRIGDFYREGIAREVDMKEARRWYEKAVEEDDQADALLEIARMEEDGAEDDADAFTRALTYYEKAANEGNLEAIAIVAQTYLDGRRADFRPNVAARFFAQLLNARKYEYVDEYCAALLAAEELEALDYFTDIPLCRHIEGNYEFYHGYLQYYALGGTTKNTQWGLINMMKAAKDGFAPAETWVLSNVEKYSKKKRDVSRIWERVSINNPDAYFWKGRLAYENPEQFSSEKNPLAMMREAAEAGSVDAMRFLNELRLNEVVGAPTKEEIIDWLTPFAENSFEAASECLESIQLEESEDEDQESLSSSYEDRLA